MPPEGWRGLPTETWQGLPTETWRGLPTETWRGLLYAVGKLAIKFVSGPGAIASALRTGLLPAPFSTRSVPIDVG
jgi:hypothetical protein